MARRTSTFSKLCACVAFFAVSSHAAIPPPSTYDWEAQRWQTQVVTNGSTLSAAAYRAGTTFMLQSKWWGVRPQLGRVNLYVGTDLAAAAVPIIRDWFTSSDKLDTFPNFVAGDFSESTGLTGNASTKYLYPNGGAAFPALTYTTFTVATNLHMAVYNRSATNESSYTMGFQGGSVPFPAWYFAISYANVTYSALGDTANAMTNADVNGVGFYLSTRRATTDAAVYKNGVSFASNTTSDTTALAGVEMIVHSLNQPAVGPPPAGLPTSRTLSYYGLGFSIPAAMAKPYYDAVQNVQTAMGRAK